MLNLKKRYQGLLFLRDEECFNDITTDDNGAWLNQEATKESMLWGHLMMGNSKMFRSSIRVTMELIFANLEMDVIMRLTM